MKDVVMMSTQTKDDYFEDIDCGEWNGKWPEMDQLFRGFENASEINWPAVILEAVADGLFDFQSHQEPSTSMNNANFSLPRKYDHLISSNEMHSETSLPLLFPVPLLPEKLRSFISENTHQVATNGTTAAG